jgi:hypothetical protein
VNGQLVFGNSDGNNDTIRAIDFFFAQDLKRDTERLLESRTEFKSL